MLIRRIARPMLAAAFIATGVEVIRRPETLAETAQPYIDKAKGALPPTAADFIPSDPQVVVRVNGAIHIVGGLALATGKFPRLAALSLASVVVPTTLAGHDFWNETDPHERAEQQAHFIQNVGLLGGLLLATVDTEGKPSLAWRGRKAAAAAGEKVASALPTGSSGSATTEVLTDKASHLAGLVSERTGELAEVAADRGGKFADVASERAAELAHKASEKASTIADVAVERGSEFSDVAAKRGAVLAAIASDRAAEFADVASKKGEHLTEVASDRVATLSKAATKKQAKLGKEAGKKQAKFAKLAAKEQAKLAKKAAKNRSTAKDLAAERSAELADSAAKAWASTNGYAEHYLNTVRDRAPELVERAADERARLAALAREQAKKAQKKAEKAL